MTYSPSIFAAAGTLVATGQESIPRLTAATVVAVSSGNMRTAVFRARKSETTTQVRMVCATAASGGASGVTALYIGLYTVDSTGAMTRVAVTANSSTLFNSTGLKTVSWSSSYAITAGTLLAVGVTATFDSTTAPQVSAGLGPASGEVAALPPVALLLGTTSGVPSTSYSAGTVTASTSQFAPYSVLLP
jgi:hypothetical protein